MPFKHYLPVLIFFPLAVIQLTIIPLISIDHVGPDLIVVLLVYYTLMNGQVYGTILGFVLGLLFDLISGGLLGSAMFAKTLAGFSAGYFYNENKIEQNVGTMIFIFIVFVCSAIDSFAYSVLAYSGTGINTVFLIFEMSILPGVYTAILTFPFLIFKTRKIMS
ncbi:rod shape-determining protein MreD [Bacteroidota bacterium]